MNNNDNDDDDDDNYNSYNKRENMHTNRCGNTRREKCCAKGSGKEVKIQEFMYRDTTNVEPEMYDYTSVGYCRLCLIDNYSVPTVTKFIIAFWLYRL